MLASLRWVLGGNTCACWQALSHLSMLRWQGMFVMDYYLPDVWFRNISTTGFASAREVPCAKSAEEECIAE